MLACILALSFVLLAISGVRAEQQAGSGVCVMLDAGHGAPDGGCTGADGTTEAPLNLAVTLKLKKALEKHGVRVLLTRTDENGIHTGGDSIGEKKRSDMRKRRKLRDTSGADLFVSVHMNLFSQPQYAGAQMIYDTKHPQAQQAALLMQQAIGKDADPENRRVPMAAAKGIYLLQDAKVPSVIAECGFLSNPAEREKLKTDTYQQVLADALCKGILQYFENQKSGEKIDGETTELKR